jgi:acetylornithine/succinyldiaminopimelate/putrescine aminotransferase
MKPHSVSPIVIDIVYPLVSTPESFEIIMKNVFKMSAVLASDEVMNLMKPGIHETTWGGNVLGCKIAMQTLKVVKNDCLVDNAQKMGTLLRQNLLCALSKDDMPVLRGKGLLTSFKIDHSEFILFKPLGQGLKIKLFDLKSSIRRNLIFPSSLHPLTFTFRFSPNLLYHIMDRLHTPRIGFKQIFTRTHYILVFSGI